MMDSHRNGVLAPSVVSLRPLLSPYNPFARQKCLQLATSLGFTPALVIPFLAMADGIYPGVPALDGEWTGSSSPDLPPYPLPYPHAYPTGLLSGLYSLIQSGPTKGIDEGSRTIYPEIPVPQV